VTAWPDVPTRVLICRDDRLFPPGFLGRIAREHLGITPDVIDGGHAPALSRPHELADRLEAYAARQGLIPAGHALRRWDNEATQAPKRATGWVRGGAEPGSIM